MSDTLKACADRPIRVTTLDNREGAEYYWPGRQVLASSEGLCCIGCNGLTYGLTREQMIGQSLPHSAGHPIEYYSAWLTPVPLRIRELCLALVTPYLPDAQVEVFNTLDKARGVASFINDWVATEHPRVAAEALRILFAWVGDQVGEIWVIDFKEKETV